MPRLKHLLSNVVFILIIYFNCCIPSYAQSVLPHRDIHVISICKCPIYLKWQYMYHSTLKHHRWYSAAVGGMITVAF